MGTDSSEPQNPEDGETDDWSDPEAVSFFSGVTVPAFLQPLLGGIDFLPYLTGRPEEIIIEEEREDDIQEEETSEEDDILWLDAEEILDNSTSALSSNDDQEVIPRWRLLKRATGRKKGRTRLIKTIQTAMTPKRKGRASSVSSFYDFHSASSGLFNQEQDALTVRQAELHRLREKAKAIQQNALEIANRIESLQSDTSNLQRVLLESSIIDREAGLLENTQQELESMQKQVVQSAHAVVAVVEAMRQPPKTTESAKSSTPLTSPLLHQLFRSVTPSHAQKSVPRRRSSTEDNSFIPKTPPLMTASSSAKKKSNTSPRELRRSASLDTPNRPRAQTEPKSLRKCESFSYIRISDLDTNEVEVISADSSMSGSQHSLASFGPDRSPNGFFSVDENLPLLLDKLNRMGFEVVTDESRRFTPTRETEKLVNQCNCSLTSSDPCWPICPWYCVPTERDVLVWVGGVPHKGFGHDWPVVKARGIVRTTPRALLDFVLDSSQIRRYNKMSQGREDVAILQDGVDTTAEQSVYGFAGSAKIMRALNKPKLLPKTIEMLSLWNARPLPQAPGSYIIVSRSVWEDGTGTPPHGNDKLRSEMLLGVMLFRPVGSNCELTTITHVYAQGVPEVLAKRAAPNSAASMIRDLQAVFL